MPALAFPNNVRIETSSPCNGHCGCCPHPETRHTQPAGRRDDALFDSVVEPCAARPLELAGDAGDRAVLATLARLRPEPGVVQIGLLREEA